ncbi:MAG: response regulator [Deltaproteobacteria bacterium]|nr:response regulator [Deltaproteobacteria bacterium]
MKHDLIPNHQKTSWLTGIGRTLTLAFLILSLVPAGLLSWISYKNAYSILKEETEMTLKIAATSRTNEIHAYFNTMLEDLRYQAETNTNTKLLEKLIKSYQSSGKDLGAFVNSYKWAKIVDQFAPDIKKFRKAFDYYDIFLISQSGDILFSVAGEEDLGTNLFTSQTRYKKFATAARQSIESGVLSFSDYERYAPSNDLVSGFICYPVINKVGDRIGALAFQFTINSINRIMQAKTRLGETSDLYLLGSDLTLRSQSLMDKEKKMLDDKILTAQSELIQAHIDKKGSVKYKEQDAFIYQNHDGQTVLGIHLPLKIQDVTFWVVAEISTKAAFIEADKLKQTILIMLGATIFVILLITFTIVRRIVNPVLELSSGVKRIEQGDFSQPIVIVTKNEIGDLANSFNNMTQSLKNSHENNALEDWYKTGQMEMIKKIAGISNLSDACKSVITYLCKYISADIGALYLVHDDDRLKLTASYSFTTRKRFSSEFEFGKGVVGQAALEKESIVLTYVPDDYIAVQSGIGESTPAAILVKPFVLNNVVIGVIEMGCFEPFSEKALAFIDLVSDSIAISFQTILSNMQVNVLLEKSQIQTEELQSQQEELKSSNEELEEQTMALKASEEELKVQGEELQASNEELTEKTEYLHKQQTEVEEARQEIEKKAGQLEQASQYKSEFLANMSHELRSPLNSLLILSQNLADNDDGNLTKEQVESAGIIHKGGKDLLHLINDILDLSKIEAGRMDIIHEKTELASLMKQIEEQSQILTNKKEITFISQIDPNVPKTLITDSIRVIQILRNLISNAVKFTKKGSVTLKAVVPAEKTNFQQQNMSYKNTIGFAVVDTGIGIAKEKQNAIFEAFIQAEGSTVRKYGGTGLGLTISRRFADLLGGELTLESKEGQGSTFTLYLPLAGTDRRKDKIEKQLEPLIPVQTILAEQIRQRQIISADIKPLVRLEGSSPSDDRDRIRVEEDKALLIIEDDPAFAMLIQQKAIKKGYMTLLSKTGREGLLLAQEYRPKGIVLDLGLPDIDGALVLDGLKQNFATRHIPVHVISGRDQKDDILKKGAVSYWLKPVDKEAIDTVLEKVETFLDDAVKKILVVEDEKVYQDHVKHLLSGKNIEIDCVENGHDAVKIMGEVVYDCVVLDLNLPDISGLDVLTQFTEKIKGVPLPPVVVYTSRDLTKEEQDQILLYARRVVLKGPGGEERLLDDVSLFLHSVESALPREQRHMLKMLHDDNELFKEKKVLLVDDDMRNIYAMTGLLQKYRLKVTMADNGKKALEKIKEQKFDIVLMDIMMPEMDGYEATRRIRAQKEYKKLPIIALTAKAMLEDREKCLQAGVSDYLAKPVDRDKLLSMLKVWLFA